MWRGARPSRTTLDSAKTLIRPVAPGNRDLKAGRLVAGVRERDRSARLEHNSVGSTQQIRSKTTEADYIFSPERFTGEIAVGEECVPVSLVAGAGPSGRLELEVDPISGSSRGVSALMQSLGKPGNTIEELSLACESSDGKRLTSDRAYIAGVLSSSAGEWQTWPMKSDTPSYHGYRFPPEIISHAVWLYHRFCVSFRDVEDLLAQRGITVSYEAIRLWCIQFGSEYARRLKRRQGRLGDTWHLDEVFVTIQGQRHYLWRAVDQDGDSHRHPRPVASRPPGCQTLYPQAVEGSGE